MRYPDPSTAAARETRGEGEEGGSSSSSSSSWSPHAQNYHEQPRTESEESSAKTHLDDAGEKEYSLYQCQQQQLTPALVSNTCLPQVTSSVACGYDELILQQSFAAAAVNLDIKAQQLRCFSNDQHDHPDDESSDGSLKSCVDGCGYDETSSSTTADESTLVASAVASDNGNAKNDSSTISFANVKGVWIGGSDSTNSSIHSSHLDLGAKSVDTSVVSSTSRTNSSSTTPSPGGALHGPSASGIILSNDYDCYDFYSAIPSVRSSSTGDMDHEINFNSWSSSSSYCSNNSNSRVTHPAATGAASDANGNDDSMETLERGLWEIKLQRCLLEIHGPAAADSACDRDKMQTSLLTNKNNKLSSDNLFLLEQQQHDKTKVLSNDDLDDPRYSLCHLALDYEYNDGHDSHAEFDLLYNALEDESNAYRNRRGKPGNEMAAKKSPLIHEKGSRESIMSTTLNTASTTTDIGSSSSNNSSKNGDIGVNMDDDSDTTTSHDERSPRVMLLPQHYLAQLSPPAPLLHQGKEDQDSDSSLSTAKAERRSSSTPDCIAVSDGSHSELSDHWPYLHHHGDEPQHHKPTAWLYQQEKDIDDFHAMSIHHDDNSAGHPWCEAGSVSPPLPIVQSMYGHHTPKVSVSLRNEFHDNERATNVVKESNLLTAALRLKSSASLPRSSSFLSSKSMSVTHVSTASSEASNMTNSCSVVVGNFSSMLLDRHNTSSCLFTSDDDNDSEWTDSMASSSMASTDLSAAAYKSCCDADSATDRSIGRMANDDNTSFVSARDDRGDLTDDDDDDDGNDDDVEQQMTPDQQSNSQSRGVPRGRQTPQAPGSKNLWQHDERKSEVGTSPKGSSRKCCKCQCHRQHLSYQMAGLFVIALLMIAVILWGHLEGKTKSDPSKGSSSSRASYLSGPGTADLFSTNIPTLAPVPLPLGTVQAAAVPSSPSLHESAKQRSNDLFS